MIGTPYNVTHVTHTRNVEEAEELIRRLMSGPPLQPTPAGPAAGPVAGQPTGNAAVPRRPSPPQGVSPAASTSPQHRPQAGPPPRPASGPAAGTGPPPRPATGPVSSPGAPPSPQNRPQPSPRRSKVDVEMEPPGAEQPRLARPVPPREPAHADPRVPGWTQQLHRHPSPLAGTSSPPSLIPAATLPPRIPWRVVKVPSCRKQVRTKSARRGRYPWKLGRYPQ
ncbi:PREDICTED: proline-rich protein HaeIII subfamily 1-like [Branchiostoma belcheri]|uniref:Proline-rich protein HaeIII subfamily 1-like n=1 Tax=Branchiostoma belcheri TaxID=7741 RepID=A0A6P5ABG1_BRABE|nr:PREDICTED: proline-rich protein HaeIII subfamily 1-like [Branchiostoma belcheri]